METQKPKFFTGDDCSGCRTLKQVIGEDISKFQVIDVSTEEGAKLASIFNVRQLPSIVTPDRQVLSGVQAGMQYIKSI